MIILFILLSFLKQKVGDTAFFVLLSFTGKESKKIIYQKRDRQNRELRGFCACKAV